MPGSINCIDNKTTDSSFFVEDTDNAATTSNLDMRKSRSGGIINSGDTIGNVRFMGFDGAAYQVGARIFGITNGTIGAGQMPTDLFFSTSPDSVSSDLIRMTIFSTGEVTISAPDSGTGLTIGGGGEIITAGDLQVQAGNIFLPDSDVGLNVGVYYLNGLSFMANWGVQNTYLGESAGVGAATGTENTGIGTVALAGLSTGSRNTAVGSLAGSSFNASDCTYIGAEAGTLATAGDNNTSIGSKSLNTLDTGSYNIAIGYLSGSNYTGAESDNIIIGNAGTLADGNTIRIGTQGSGAGQQDTCFIAGIAGVSVSNLAFVSIDTVSGQLGSTSSGGIATQFDADSGSATPSSGILNIFGAGTVTTSASGNTVTITGSGGSGFTWTVVTGATQSMAVNNGYIANNGGTCVMTLPATAAVGDVVRVTGINNDTGWQIAQNAGQTIYFGDSNTTTGATGYLASSLTRDSIELVCVVADNDWNVLSCQGNVEVN